MVNIEKCNYSQFVCFKSLFDAFQLLIEFDTQLWNFDYKRLLHKAYVNGVILRGKNLYLKYCQSFEQKLQRGQDFFQRGTMSLCRSKGCKVRVRQ